MAGGPGPTEARLGTCLACGFWDYWDSDKRTRIRAAHYPMATAATGGDRGAQEGGPGVWASPLQLCLWPYDFRAPTVCPGPLWDLPTGRVSPSV